MRSKTGIMVIALILIITLAGCTQTTPPQKQTGLPGNASGKQKSSPGPLTQIHMVNQTDGWAMTQSSVWRTKDGGANWTNVMSHSGGNPGTADFLDASSAWVVYNQQGENDQSLNIFRTTDGGQTWRSATIRPANGSGPFFPVSLQFLDANHGWLMVSCGVAMGSEGVEVYRADDGGAIWSKVAAAGPEAQKQDELPFGGDKTGLSFVNRQDGWLTGSSPAPGVYLYATLDGGETWKTETLSIPAGSAEGGGAVTYPAFFFGFKEGFLPAVFYAQKPVLVFYETKNGGETWMAGTPMPSSANCQGFHWSFVNAKQGFASDGYKFFVTLDGARTWTAVSPNIDLQNLTQMDFVSDKAGWAIVNGALKKTTDGGLTWRAVTAIF